MRGGGSGERWRGVVRRREEWSKGRRRGESGERTGVKRRGAEKRGEERRNGGEEERR